MFQQFSDEQPPTIRALKIIGILAPIFFLFVYLGKAEMEYRVENSQRVSTWGGPLSAIGAIRDQGETGK